MDAGPAPDDAAVDTDGAGASPGDAAPNPTADAADAGDATMPQSAFMTLNDTSWPQDVSTMNVKALFAQQEMPAAVYLQGDFTTDSHQYTVWLSFSSPASGTRHCSLRAMDLVLATSQLGYVHSEGSGVVDLTEFAGPGGWVAGSYDCDVGLEWMNPDFTVVHSQSPLWHLRGSFRVRLIR